MKNTLPSSSLVQVTLIDSVKEFIREGKDLEAAMNIAKKFGLVYRYSLEDKEIAAVKSLYPDSYIEFKYCDGHGSESVAYFMSPDIANISLDNDDRRFLASDEVSDMIFGASEISARIVHPRVVKIVDMGGPWYSK